MPEIRVHAMNAASDFAKGVNRMPVTPLEVDQEVQSAVDAVARFDTASAPKPEAKPTAKVANKPHLDQDKIMLGVLAAIDRNSEISQRAISSDLGVALGLANAYLKRCVRKGWIKVQQAPRRRYAYYLTPQGFAEKTRLAGEYFSSSFTYFRRARGQMSDLMGVCSGRGWQKIAFAGLSDLAEIGFICAHDFPVTIVGFVDPARAGERYCGLPVVAAIAEFGPVDAIIVTSLEAPEATYRAISMEIEANRVLAPGMLRVALPKNVDFEDLDRAAE